MTIEAFEAWRCSLDRTARFEGSTAAAAIKAAYKACGVGTRARFRSWLLSLGLTPFNTGKAWVLNVQAGDGRKLTARPIPPSGAETY